MARFIAQSCRQTGYGVLLGERRKGNGRWDAFGV